MIYYIDVQPIKKKSRFSMKKVRLWVYSAALALSICLIVPISFGQGNHVQSIAVSSAEFSNREIITDTTKTDVTEELSVTAFAGFVSPLDSAYISSHYGYRTNPVSGKYKLHSGLDLACGEGSSIYAVLGGTVTTSEYSNSYGNYIIIDHENGYQTLYAHCSKLLKSKGDTVKRGDVIALVGSTGNSTGPHLHIEVRENGERLDPEPYFGQFFQ